MDQNEICKKKKKFSVFVAVQRMFSNDMQIWLSFFHFESKLNSWAEEIWRIFKPCPILMISYAELWKK